MRGTMTRSTTIQAVLTALRRDIIMKNLEDASPVIEIVFAEKYSCSRAALRGALTVLEQEGLIKVMPNGTKTISALSDNDINHLYELRKYVECSAAKQLLEKENMDISKLIKALEGEKASFLDADAAFHETLVSLSGNKALMQVWKTFMPVMKELFLLNFSVAKKMEDTLNERHMKIAKLLLDRNAKAIYLLEEHIEEARKLSVGKNKS